MTTGFYHNLSQLAERTEKIELSMLKGEYVLHVWKDDWNVRNYLGLSLEELIEDALHDHPDRIRA